LPPVHRPLLRRAVAFGHQEHGGAELGTRTGSQGYRSREVGVDAEVGADAAENVVDRERSERVLELRRSPPPVSLEWMITQVDEATVVVVAVERLVIDPARKSLDAVGEPRLGNRACDQPGFVADGEALRDPRLAVRER